MNERITDILEKINARLGGLGKAPAVFIPAAGPDPDGAIQIFGEVRRIEFKKNLMPGRLAYLGRQLAGTGVMLFADYLTPAVADMLARQNIEYADGAGNLFLKDAGNCILIQNCAKPKRIERENKQGRAFAPTGLKVLFLLLTEVDALNWNYRKIGEYAGVSLGAVNYVMADLQTRRLLRERQGKLHVVHFAELLARWVDAYVEKMFGKHAVRRYRGELKELPPRCPVALAGETAAADLKLMRTDHICLYQWGNINELIQRNRWTPDENGNIAVRAAFWPPIREFRPGVPPLLIYADLVAENDSRCLEVAKIVYERYLQENADEVQR